MLTVQGECAASTPTSDAYATVTSANTRERYGAGTGDIGEICPCTALPSAAAHPVAAMKRVQPHSPAGTGGSGQKQSQHFQYPQPYPA